MQTTSSELSDADEFEELNGVPVAAFGFSPDAREWVFVFTDGRRLILSSGEEAYYMLSSRLH